MNRTLSSKLLFLICELRKDVFESMVEKILPPKDQWDNWSPGEVAKVRENFLHEIDWAMQHLKRRDRITWFLRYAQFYYWNKLVTKGDDVYKNKFKSFVRAMQTRFNFPTPGNQYGDHYYQYIQEHLEDLKQVLTYFLDMHIPEFENHEFTDDGFQIFMDWKVIADNIGESKKGISRSEEEASHGVEDFITFPNGWKWVLKHVPYCSLEGQVMGHCGNHSEFMKPDDELLSLRSPTDDPDVWEPHLTVALNHGMLRDMVGKKNAAPSHRYKGYIDALMEDPRVEGME